MRRFLLLTALAVAIAGCQTAPQAYTYRWKCTDRPFDAGLCDQPTNWRISDLIVRH